jgi:hypothetical protein
MSPKFAARRWEVDPTYLGMRVLHIVGAIDMTGAQKMRWTPGDERPRADVGVLADAPLDPAE